MSLLRSAFFLGMGAACLSAAILTPEQAIRSRSVNELTFSEDGSKLACSVSEPLKGASPQSHIWVLSVADGRFEQFTHSAKTERSPRWSPDGHALAFLSDREERMQIYLIRMDGGEALPLTSGKNAPGNFRWSPDGKQIAFMAPEPKGAAEEKKETDKDDAKVADRADELARLWTVEVESKKVRQVTHGAWRIDSFEWLSAERLIAIATDQPKTEKWTDAIYTVETATGAFARFSQPGQPFGGLTISKDRSEIGFEAARRAGPMPFDLFLGSAQGGAAEDVTGGLDRAVLGTKWQNGTTAVVSVADGFRSRLYRVSKESKPAAMELPYSNGDFDISGAGTLAFVGIGFNRLPELFVKAADGTAKQVSHVQEEAWSAIALAKAELFRFKSFDGTAVEAALMKPAVSSSKALPLIVYVHGGPAGDFTESYNTWAQLLTAHGYGVVMVNPRGSAGYGEEFLKANKADWGGGDYKDILAGMEAVMARGGFDAQRVGIGGWSYGGYMAEWAITQTNRFKAAVAGAGMFDLGAEFGTEVGPEGDEWYFGTPWEHPERFVHDSPMTYIKNAKTPTLILQGENDPIDPMGQSTALYRALKRYDVPTELVTYPREPHGPREEKHQVDVLTRMLGWFDRYLNPAGAPAA